MKIGIIGAGQIGGTLARRFTELGHQVSVDEVRSAVADAVCDALDGRLAVTLTSVPAS